MMSFEEAIYQVYSRDPPVQISSWRYWRSLTELIVSDAIQFTVINSLPGRIRGAAPGSHQDLGLIFIGRFSLLTIKKQEVYHFFCNGGYGGIVSKTFRINTSIVVRFEQFLFEFFFVLETSQTVHGLKVKKIRISLEKCLLSVLM